MKKNIQTAIIPIKEAIRPYIKNKGWLWSVIVVSLAVVFLAAARSKISETMLYWLLSASAQSMAALFAVIGMFAVFRHEYLRGIVRNNIDVLKANLKTSEWREFFGLGENPDCWDDSIVVPKIKELLQKVKDQSPHVYYNNAEVSTLALEANQAVLKYLPIYTRVPMILVLITFLISIISIPFTSLFAMNIAGWIILVVLLPCELFSMFGIYKYFEITLTTK